MRFVTFTLALLLACAVAQAREINAPDDATLSQALRSAQPGDIITLGPGPYKAGLHIQDIRGTADKPIRITGPAPGKPARITPKNSAFQFSRVQHLVIENLHITKAASNGVNIDDGGDIANFPNVTTHMTLRHVTFEDIGPQGNVDALKLSGLSQFLIEHCTFDRWGDGGGGIDGVGCANGTIQHCTFKGGRGSTGIQLKGGSRDITIRQNLFDDCAPRAINCGGSTGLQFFRPKPQGFEAKDITIEGNIFIGSDAAIAFPNTDGSLVRYNTIYAPKRWAFRILQETRSEGFTPSRNVRIEDNLIAFRSTQWFEGGINIGPHVDAPSFKFARNAWWCIDAPAKSTPKLPSQEVDGIYGKDPLFTDPAKKDLTLKTASPLKKVGHTALPQQKP